jgi:hypothetical protein
MDVAAEPIELGNEDRAFCFSRPRQCGGELWPTVQSVGTFARLDLDMLGNYLDPLRIGEPLDCGSLGLDPQSALALPGGGNRFKFARGIASLFAYSW